MTNAMIIMNESISLMNKGILKGSGQFVEMQNEDGDALMVEVPEEIHTFNWWKSRGYAVRKGQKSFIKFPIWKRVSKKVKTDDGEEEESRMFMKLSYFFTLEQVEPMRR